MIQRIIFISLWLVLLVIQVSAQDQSSCDERKYHVDYPRVDPVLWCIENPVVDEDVGEWAFTALAFGDDGTLYATRPQSGEVLAMRDTDGDSLVDSPFVIAQGLRLPNGLAYADGVLYIMGDGIVYRYQDGETSILVDDLPGGRGFMASAITVHGERLYVAIPFPCDFCVADNELEGTVLSFALDGSDRKIVARGLRYPSSLLYYDGALWVTDTARDGLRDVLMLDELNRIDLGSSTIPNFGFPYCYGSENTPDMSGDFDCNTATAPTLSFNTHSTPIAMADYESSTYPFINGNLLIAFAGSFDNSLFNGYAIYTVNMRRDDGRIYYEAIMPADPVIAGDAFAYTESSEIILYLARIVNQRGAGIWPHRVYGITISNEGWIYFSAKSRIYVLTPGSRDVCGLHLREC